MIKHSVTAALSWYFSGYRLQWRFDPKLAKELFDFGKFLVGLQALHYIGQNANNFVIGKSMGVASVGYYTLAANVGHFVNSHFTHIISRVMFPAYSAIQDDREAVNRAYLKAVKFITMLSLPYSFALISLAKEFVLTVYGERWLSIVPLIRLLGLVQMVVPIYFASESVYHGCGRPSYSFKMNLAGLLFGIPLMVILTLSFGLIGTVLSTIVMTWILTPVSVFLVYKITGLDRGEFLRQLFPAGVCSLVMFSSILAARELVRVYSLPLGIGLNHWVLLVFLSLVGLASYAISFLLVDRQATREVKNMIFKLEGVWG
jgi:PST family polysaccharide transporter/lipopolysaccharide exporter